VAVAAGSTLHGSIRRLLLFSFEKKPRQQPPLLATQLQTHRRSIYKGKLRLDLRFDDLLLNFPVRACSDPEQVCKQ
jgi:hypothetical protein